MPGGHSHRDFSLHGIVDCFTGPDGAWWRAYLTQVVTRRVDARAAVLVLSLTLSGAGWEALGDAEADGGRRPGSTP